MKATEPWCSIIAEQFGDKTQMYNLSVLHSSPTGAVAEMLMPLGRAPSGPVPTLPTRRLCLRWGKINPCKLMRISLAPQQVIAEPQTCGQSSLAFCRPRYSCHHRGRWVGCRAMLSQASHCRDEDFSSSQERGDGGRRGTRPSLSPPSQLDPLPACNGAKCLGNAPT